MTRDLSDYSKTHDEGLVVRIKEGDQAACRHLVEIYRPRMLAVARRYMRCEDDCNDAVQDAFISAFKGLDRFEGQSRLSTWLQRITVNACLMILRRGSYQREISIDAVLPIPTTREKAVSKSQTIDDPAIGIEADEAR